MRGTKQSHPLVPALRFKEFEGEWVKNKLIDWSLVVLDGDRGSNYPSGDEFQSEGYCLFMNAKNVTKTGFSFEHKMFITKEKDEILRKGKLKREDLVLTTRGSVGHIAYYDQSVPFDNLRINSGMVLIRNENDVISSKFIYINFFTPNLIRQVSTISFGSAQPQLTVKEINKFKFNIPTLPEQQKIASFLSAVDEKIQQLTKKKALLEHYKKGLMQQLFSGQLRFKDENGKDYPDWEEKRLGEISKITTGSSNREDSGLDGEFTFFDRSKDIRTSSIYLFDGEAIIVPGEGQEFIPKYFIGKFDLHQRTYAIMNFENSISKFLFFYVHYHRHYFFRQAVGTTVKSLRLPMFKKMPVKLPCIEEQQKIARYLSGIDTKIESVNNKITQTQTFKKGLLQQMFV
ncbi:MAG: restriction endonuclease subunit S [Flavobacteriales bacterium]